MAEEKRTKIEKEITKPVEEKPIFEKKESDKKESTPAVIKSSKTKKKSEPKIELEREYVVPLRKGTLKAPQYRRAKKAIRVLREFLVRHMKVRDRDLKKVKIDIHLNNELWFKGIKKPANKIKIKAKKIDGIVYAELADIPEVIKFAIAREEKQKEKAKTTKVKKSKVEKTEEEKTEEKEDDKSLKEKSTKIGKASVKTEKHTTKGSHMKKTSPVRNNPKK